MNVMPFKINKAPLKKYINLQCVMVKLYYHVYGEIHTKRSLELFHQTFYDGIQKQIFIYFKLYFLSRAENMHLILFILYCTAVKTCFAQTPQKNPAYWRYKVFHKCQYLTLQIY